tara:strand:+ start:510 stop:692 length:183 start_codon:yes stop_codon:yes gene_type:complete
MPQEFFGEAEHGRMHLFVHHGSAKPENSAFAAKVTQVLLVAFVTKARKANFVVCCFCYKK